MTKALSSLIFSICMRGICRKKKKLSDKQFVWLQLRQVSPISFFLFVPFFLSQERTNTGQRRHRGLRLLDFLRGLETRRIKIKGEGCFKWLIALSGRRSAAGQGRAGQESVWRTSGSFTLQSVRWKLPLLSKWRCLLKGGQGEEKEIKRESYATCAVPGCGCWICSLVGNSQCKHVSLATLCVNMGWNHAKLCRRRRR